MPNFFQVAIDGPVAAGKGSVARRIAEQLNFLYLDTGAMYRSATLLFLEKKLAITADNQQQLVALLKKVKLELKNINEQGELKTLIFLAGRDISQAIRTPLIDKNVSLVAALPLIREVLVKKQQQMAHSHHVVMEGRDIGTRVLPHAQVKIYLTASLSERAKRRFLQQQPGNPQLKLTEVEQDIARRDHLDSNRDTDPLAVAEQAIVFDTTKLNLDEVVKQLVHLIAARLEQFHPASE